MVADLPLLIKLDNLGELLTPKQPLQLGAPLHNTIPPPPPARPKTENDISHLLLQQNRRIQPTLGDGDCFFVLCSTTSKHSKIIFYSKMTFCMEFMSNPTHLFQSLVHDQQR